MYVCELHASSARSSQKRMPSLELDLQAALRVLEPNPSPLQQQSVLSTAKPSLQPLVCLFVDFGKFVVALFCLFFRFCMILFLFYDSVTAQVGLKNFLPQPPRPLELQRCGVSRLTCLFVLEAR